MERTSFRILFFRGNRTLESAPVIGDEDKAKATARREFDKAQAKRGATGAAVIDSQGRVVLALSSEEFT